MGVHFSRTYLDINTKNVESLSIELISKNLKKRSANDV